MKKLALVGMAIAEMTAVSVGGAAFATDLPQDFAMPPKCSGVACTVPADQADLTGTLRAAYVSKYTGRVEKDAETYASEGLVTYTATWTQTGLTVIFH